MDTHPAGVPDPEDQCLLDDQPTRMRGMLSGRSGRRLERTLRSTLVMPALLLVVGLLGVRGLVGALPAQVADLILAKVTPTAIATTVGLAAVLRWPFPTRHDEARLLAEVDAAHRRSAGPTSR